MTQSSAEDRSVSSAWCLVLEKSEGWARSTPIAEK